MPYVRKVNAIRIWRKFKKTLKPGSYVKNEFQFRLVNNPIEFYVLHGYRKKGITHDNAALSKVKTLSKT